MIRADRVIGEVQGRLRIESLQATQDYRERSSPYRSVGEQSAIRAGDGGFDLHVHGRTELVGGQITSTEAAVQGGRNRLRSDGGVVTSDLVNSATYSAGMSGVGFGSAGARPARSARRG